MEDWQIVALYWARAETAIAETSHKYAAYCRAICYRILGSEQDSEECVNDTWLRAWESIPPHRPVVLKTFLGKIARHLALDRYDCRTAEKRGMGQAPLVLEELQECLPAPDNTEQIVDGLALTEILNRFLASLPAEQRKIFMGRYWYFRTIRELSAGYGVSESKVKMSLLRSRKKLREILEKEGISV